MSTIAVIVLIVFALGITSALLFTSAMGSSSTLNTEGALGDAIARGFVEAVAPDQAYERFLQPAMVAGVADGPRTVAV